MKKALTVVFFILFSTAVPLWAQIDFSNLNLKGEKELLFSSRVSSPVFGSYETLFHADVESRKIETLTFFPEKIEYLNQAGVIQVQNRFGLFRSDSSLTRMDSLVPYPSFQDGDPVQNGKILPQHTSPDGRFLVYYQADSEVFGTIFLYDTETSQKLVIAEEIELNFNDGFGKWSPDSRFFVYSKGGDLFYYSVQHITGEEKYSGIRPRQKLGKGKLKSFKWGKNNNIYYMDESYLYKIEPMDFFSRPYYTELVLFDYVIGKIAFDFDPEFDEFWVSPDEQKVLVKKDESHLFLFYLNENEIAREKIIPLPHLVMNQGNEIGKVLWSKNDKILILVENSDRKIQSNLIVALDFKSGEDNSFRILPQRGVLDAALSPDGTSAAVLLADQAAVFSFERWVLIKNFPVIDPLDILWKSNSDLIVSSRFHVSQFSLEGFPREFLFPSQPGQTWGYGPDGEIYSRSGEDFFRFIQNDRFWTAAQEILITKPLVYGPKYRVYLEKTAEGPYEHIVMVRRAQENSFGTYPLFHNPEKDFSPFPELDEKDYWNGPYFRHGSRIRRREVSVVFNMEDSVEGLSYVLRTLAEYDIKATFFLSGDVVRRHPEAVKKLAQSGHEIGSLFYTQMDLTDGHFGVDAEFIIQGLAVNEDRYFELTGKELERLWHAPYYVMNGDILEATKQMNYYYVGRDVDPLDWVEGSSRFSGGNNYRTAVSLTDRLLEIKEPGSIIPVRIGRSLKREDYLYTRLDLLLDGLIRRGYICVPVSVLMEHTK